MPTWRRARPDCRTQFGDQTSALLAPAAGAATQLWADAAAAIDRSSSGAVAATATSATSAGSAAPPLPGLGACRDAGQHRREFSAAELALAAQRYESALNGTAHGVAMCLAIKGQREDVGEWVEYHRGLGVDRIYVYDTGSVPPLEDVLAPYTQVGGRLWVAARLTAPARATPFTLHLRAMPAYSAGGLPDVRLCHQLCGGGSRAAGQQRPPLPAQVPAVDRVQHVPARPRPQAPLDG